MLSGQTHGAAGWNSETFYKKQLMVLHLITRRHAWWRICHSQFAVYKHLLLTLTGQRNQTHSLNYNEPNGLFCMYKNPLGLLLWLLGLQRSFGKKDGPYMLSRTHSSAHCGHMWPRTLPKRSEWTHFSAFSMHTQLCFELSIQDGC